MFTKQALDEFQAKSAQVNQQVFEAAFFEKLSELGINPEGNTDEERLADAAGYLKLGYELINQLGPDIYTRPVATTNSGTLRQKAASALGHAVTSDEPIPVDRDTWEKAAAVASTEAGLQAGAFAIETNILNYLLAAEAQQGGANA